MYNEKMFCELEENELSATNGGFSWGAVVVKTLEVIGAVDVGINFVKGVIDGYKEADAED